MYKCLLVDLKKKCKHEIKTRYRFHVELRTWKREMSKNKLNARLVTITLKQVRIQISEVISGKVNKVARGRTSARVAIHG